MDEKKPPFNWNREWAGRMLLSLGVAIVLWGFVTTTRDPERTRAFANVAISTAQLADNLVIITEIPPATVTVKGPKSVVDDLNASELHATLEVANIVDPGTYTARISINTPEDIWSTSINPKSMTIVVETLTTKVFPIAAEYSGELGAQQQVQAFQPSASEVTVTGPASLVNRITKVVVPIEIGNRTGTFANTFTPVARDGNGDTIAGVTINPGTISATITVATRGKEIAVITQLSGSPAVGYEVADRRIIPDTILVDGPAAVLADLITINTDVVNISGASSDISITVDLVRIPEGVTVLDPTSGQVQVVVQIRKRGVQQPLPSQPVTIVNLGEGLVAEASPDSITLTVVGNEQEIEQLSPTSLRVQVDATGLGPGTYRLAPTVILPQNMEWTDIEPSSVTVTIREADEATPEASPEIAPSP